MQLAIRERPLAWRPFAIAVVLFTAATISIGALGADDAGGHRQVREAASTHTDDRSPWLLTPAERRWFAQHGATMAELGAMDARRWEAIERRLSRHRS